MDSGSYSELSTAAYAFRDDPSYQLLKTAINNHPELEDLRLLRHNLGRVAAWAKAAESVAKMASELDALQSYRVQVVPSQATSPLLFPHDITIGDALQRVMRSRASSDENGFATTRLLDAFEELYKSRDLSGKVHAETAMLLHFHARHMSFFDGNPYIGCSKPSCYACDLFRQCHPMRVHVRPRSGNVWANWTPLSSDRMATIGLDTSTKTTIEEMIHRMRQKIDLDASSGLREPGRTIDSITDLSSSLPTISSVA